MHIPTFLSTVVGRERITPLMERVTIGGDALRSFASTGVPDERVKLLLPPDGVTPPALPVLDETGIRFPAGVTPPVARTFTVRSFDPDRGTVTIDVALHPVGPAAAWARTVVPGAPVGLAGPNALPPPARTPERSILVGDASALPAIARTVEELPAGARAEAIVLVDGPDEEQAIASAASVSITWLHGAGAGATCLEDALRERGPLDETTYVWAAGEAHAMRGIRRYLRDDCGLPRACFRVSGYWQRRLSEDEAIDVHLQATESARAAGADEATIEDVGIY